MTDFHAAQIEQAEDAVLEAADMLPNLVDGLEELCVARRRTFQAERVLEEDLAAVELVKDQLDEKGSRVAERRKDADKATKELEKLAQELGTEAFAAREVGDLADLSIFNERQAAQKDVDAWEGEITELKEAKGFGAIVKAKAKQAQLLAKTAATKARFRGMEREIGRGLVEEGTEELVRCDQTEVVITKIKSQKETLAALEGLLNDANSDFMKTAADAADRFALDHVSSHKDLTAANKRIKEGIKQSKKDQRAAGKRILERLDVAVSLGELDHESMVWQALKGLRALHEE
ncbi:MAG: hypothetical protein KDA24_25285 [Deltaproteobacteria bacterium]|nr:hypothetical protein [Deltaproteobacteria bacterium]